MDSDSENSESEYELFADKDVLSQGQQNDPTDMDMTLKTAIVADLHHVNIPLAVSSIALGIVRGLCTHFELIKGKEHAQKRVSNVVPDVSLEKELEENLKHSLVATTNIDNTHGVVALQSKIREPESMLNSEFLRGATIPPLKKPKIKVVENAGDKWFNLTKPIITPEVEADLKALSLRGVLDPTRHYRKDETLNETPKFFAMGTVVGGATDFYSSRLTKKERKEHLVDEILHNTDVVNYVHRRASEINSKKEKLHRKNKSNRVISNPTLRT